MNERVKDERSDETLLGMVVDGLNTLDLRYPGVLWIQNALAAGSDDYERLTGVDGNTGLPTFRKPRWRVVLKIKGGHRYFLDRENKLALADASGATPDTTEDGPLYVDRTKNIGFEPMSRTFIVPLIDGRHTCADLLEAMELSRYTGMPIVAHDTRLTVGPKPAGPKQ